MTAQGYYTETTNSYLEGKKRVKRTVHKLPKVGDFVRVGSRKSRATVLAINYAPNGEPILLVDSVDGNFDVRVPLSLFEHQSRTFYYTEQPPTDAEMDWLESGGAA